MAENPNVTRVRVFKDAAGEYRWAAYAGNGEEVATSGEGYVNAGYARTAAESLWPDTDFVDETRS